MIDTPKKQPDPVPPSLSLAFATPSVVNGENLLATVPGSDGTIGAPTSYESGRDGIVKQDEDEGDDA